ncbi:MULTISPECIES: FAD-binding oxidoreductase [Rhizobium/Agrobacterium group]|uniref:FAD-binding oxidoreductase n=1 Tax=Agrobacterium cucumeris TaxID=2862866 RepID=A0ABY8RWP7_9HYPH|nr:MULTISPECIES: FAD-binding oxidoreductase [Rhizobium/Agrobacterium group]MCZ7472713.1 FAD-binding oxidoreductase [Rhizobium rhizogenes]MCZ7484039.1 FAD-binding oxidoreductase [Rhizobium rhizogenes]WHO11632.1 FAD-binding oxidoreductase [Agrobacterium cucumeris]
MEALLGGAIIGGAAGAGIASLLRYRLASGVSRAEPVATEERPPAEADVVVIGAGVAGLATALYLNEHGMKVLVLEKGVVAGEQSSRAFGWIYSNGWHPEKLELANQAKRLWEGYAGRFGEDIGYRRTGNFSLINSEEEMEAHKAWLSEAKQADPSITSRIVTGEELDRLLPGLQDRYLGALYQDSDGTIEPQYTISRLARGAQREGVTICAPCAVRQIELAGGQVAAVETEHGTIRCKTVVIAAGAWSSLLVRQLGVRLPQLGICTTMQRLSSVAGPAGAGYGRDFTWRRHADGQYSMGGLRHVSPLTLDSFRFLRDFMPAMGHARSMLKLRFGGDFWTSFGERASSRTDAASVFEHVRILSARVDRKENGTIRANATRAFPALASARVVDSWGGVIDATPDSTPVISDVANTPGVFLITGFSGNGLSVAPAAGQMLAAMIAGVKPVCNPAIYRLQRFRDGSPFVFRH